MIGYHNGTEYIAEELPIENHRDLLTVDHFHKENQKITPPEELFEAPTIFFTCN